MCEVLRYANVRPCGVCVIVQMTGWERVPAYSQDALLQAVNMQPVLVYISSSSPDFQVSTAPVPPLYCTSCTLLYCAVLPCTALHCPWVPRCVPGSEVQHLPYPLSPLCSPWWPWVCLVQRYSSPPARG